MKKVFWCLFSFFATVAVAHGQKLTQTEYIDLYKKMAVSEMKRSGVPASITLAQGILESECGNSDLVLRSNNHFGIKCKSDWTGPSVAHDDDEKGECFRVYGNAEESFKDHSDFLRTGGRYSFLFNLEPTDYKGWAYGLKQAGYATNPRYPEILIKYIETYNLQQYDVAAGQDFGTMIAASEAKAPEVMQQLPVADVATENRVVRKSSIAPFSKILVNRTKAIFVPGGTSLLAVASQNKINLSRILEWNDLKKDGLLEKDQNIFLEKKKPSGEISVYVAAGGESLHEVSQKFGVILQNLTQYNPSVNPDHIAAGARIFLQPGAVANVAEQSKTVNDANEVSGEDAISHAVTSKEGLYSIARKYGVSVDQLKSANHLTGDDLRVGQVLIISK